MGTEAAGGRRERAWRPDLFVVARFLNRLHAPEGMPPIVVSKSRLQLAVNVNYDVFRRYWDFLESKGWVQAVGGEGDPRGVSLTPEGRRAYERLAGWLRELLGSSAL